MLHHATPFQLRVSHIGRNSFSVHLLAFLVEVHNIQQHCQRSSNQGTLESGEAALNLHWSTQCCMMPTWCCNMLHAAWVQAGCWVLLGNQSINSNIFKHQTAHTSVTSCQLFLPEASRRPNGSEWRSIQKVSAHYQRSLSVSQCVSQCLWCLASTGNSSMLGSVCMPTMSVSPILFGRSSNS